MPTVSNLPRIEGGKIKASESRNTLFQYGRHQVAGETSASSRPSSPFPMTTTTQRGAGTLGPKIGKHNPEKFILGTFLAFFVIETISGFHFNLVKHLEIETSQHSIHLPCPFLTWTSTYKPPSYRASSYREVRRITHTIIKD